jgi:error-prone DNA polymerase
VFNAWLLIGVGEVRRTGARGVSLRALGAWDLLHLEALWRSTLEATGDERAAVAAVHALIDADRWRGRPGRPRVSARDGPTGPPRPRTGQGRTRIPARTRAAPTPSTRRRPGGMGQRRVLVHPSGFVQSPYTDVAPAGESPRSIPQRYADPGRKLWHSSPGSSGR